MKYPKFGHATATDYAARLIRYSDITRGKGMELIRKHDHNLDLVCVRDFCGYTETEFWNIIDKFYNRELFDRNESGKWVLKNPVWKE